MNKLMLIIERWLEKKFESKDANTVAYLTGKKRDNDESR
jgi:hypothetical protein